jgi:hypothetical protein
MIERRMRSVTLPDQVLLDHPDADCWGCTLLAIDARKSEHQQE